MKLQIETWVEMEFSYFRNKDLILGSIWILLSILEMVAAYELDVGNFQTPGPGMFPFLLGTILFICSLLLCGQLLRDIKMGGKKEVIILSRIDFPKIGATVIVLLAYGLLLEGLGFIATTFLCLVFLFKVIGSEKLRWALLFSSVTVIVSYLLFVIGLNVYMPSFPWRDICDVLF